MWNYSPLNPTIQYQSHIALIRNGRMNVPYVLHSIDTNWFPYIYITKSLLSIWLEYIFFRQLWALTSEYRNRKLDELQKKSGKFSIWNEEIKKREFPLINWHFRSHELHTLSVGVWVCRCVSGSLYENRSPCCVMSCPQWPIWRMCVFGSMHLRAFFSSRFMKSICVLMWHINVIIQTWNPNIRSHIHALAHTHKDGDTRKCNTISKIICVMWYVRLDRQPSEIEKW